MLCVDGTASEPGRPTESAFPSRVRVVSGRRLRQIAVLATLVMASLAASHELIYLLTYGAGPEYALAMRDGGHDRYWTSFILTVAGVSLVLTVIAVRLLHRLHRQTSLVRTGRLSEDRGFGLFARQAARLWLLVSAGTVAAYLAQENLETIAAGHPVPGLEVASGDHAVALPVITLMSLLVALVGALVRWRRHVLLARLHRSWGPVRRRARRTLRPSAISRPASTRGVRSHGLRAPPASGPVTA